MMFLSVYAQCAESLSTHGYCGLMTLEADGWMITFFIDCAELDYFDSCCSPDDRTYAFTSGMNALDPVALLSLEEHRKLEELLTNILMAPQAMLSVRQSLFSPVSKPRDSRRVAQGNTLSSGRPTTRSLSLRDPVAHAPSPPSAHWQATPRRSC